MLPQRWNGPGVLARSEHEPGRRERHRYPQAACVAAVPGRSGASQREWWHRRNRDWRPTISRNIDLYRMAGTNLAARDHRRILVFGGGWHLFWLLPRTKATHSIQSKRYVTCKHTHWKSQLLTRTLRARSVGQYLVPAQGHFHIWKTSPLLLIRMEQNHCIPAPSKGWK